MKNDSFNFNFEIETVQLIFFQKFVYSGRIYFLYI